MSRYERRVGLLSGANAAVDGCSKCGCRWVHACILYLSAESRLQKLPGAHRGYKASDIKIGEQTNVIHAQKLCETHTDMPSAFSLHQSTGPAGVVQYSADGYLMDAARRRTPGTEQRYLRSACTMWVSRWQLSVRMAKSKTFVARASIT